VRIAAPHGAEKQSDGIPNRTTADLATLFVNFRITFRVDGAICAVAFVQSPMRGSDNGVSILVGNVIADETQRWFSDFGLHSKSLWLGIVGGAAKGEEDVVFSECGTGFGNRIYFVLLFRAALLVGLQTGRQSRRVSGDVAGLFNDCLLVLGANSVV